MENIKKSENRTMVVILQELNDSVNKYNDTSSTTERVELATKHKNLVDEYNEASRITNYSNFVKKPYPLVELVKEYYYETISVKDNSHKDTDENGAIKLTTTRSVNYNNRRFDVVDFIKWSEEKNKSVAAEKDWLTKIGAARKFVENEWKRFFDSGKDSHSMRIGKTKDKLQEMFDALTFIPCENAKDKNALIADNNIAKWVLGFSNLRKDGKVEDEVVIVGHILPNATWKVLCLDILHKAAKKKNFEFVYGDPEAKVAEKVENNAKPTSNKPSTGTKGNSRGKGKDKQSESKPEAPNPEAK
jgi:hypothetical protein